MNPSRTLGFIRSTTSMSGSQEGSLPNFVVNSYTARLTAVCVVLHFNFKVLKRRVGFSNLGVRSSMHQVYSNVPHTHTHTHIYIYVYVSIYVHPYVYNCVSIYAYACTYSLSGGGFPPA